MVVEVKVKRQVPPAGAPAVVQVPETLTSLQLFGSRAEMVEEAIDEWFVTVNEADALAFTTNTDGLTEILTSETDKVAVAWLVLFPCIGFVLANSDVLEVVKLSVQDWPGATLMQFDASSLTKPIQLFGRDKETFRAVTVDE